MENNNDHENDNPDAAFEENDNDNDNDNHIDLAEDADEDENENENEAGGNNNIMVDIDLEEDEEDGDNDSTLDGGVAVNPEDDSSKAKKHSSECDLLLYVYCQESIDVAPDHPIMRPGVTISIGLDKTTKLKAVFKQYVDFCNSSSEVESGPKIDVQDVEFSFCQLLNENDTAETSALMKNDRIRVRKVRTSERVVEAERKRTQRDADRIYFHQMRHLLPESCPARVADITLDCQGKLVDNHGRNQRVLSTTVRAHSSMISKRCPWLMEIILQARQKARRLAAEEEKAEKCKTPDQSPTLATEIENDDEADGNSEDDGDDVKEIGRGEEAMYRDAQIDTVDDSSDDGKVNVIIVDDEDDDDDVVSASRHQIQSRSEVDLLTVILSEHSPEAVKILLEYCYTNRVVSLGHDAFVQACKTRPNKHNGPVPPYPTTHSSNAKRWPNNGIPIVPFSVALAAIKLAEEAGMHRLSLMCEISASQLVSSSNVVEALTMSTRQKTISGNDLPRLRKAAMDVILRRGRRGVSEIGRTSLFKKALQEERSIIVPTLLQGTMEAVAHWEKVKGVKRDSSEISHRSYKELDKEDSHKRARERRSRRQERTEKDPNKIREHYDDHLSDFSDEPYSEEQFMSGWVSNARAAASLSKRSLKRMAQHKMDRRGGAICEGSLNFPKVNNKRSSKSSRSQKFDVDSFLCSRDK